MKDYCCPKCGMKTFCSQDDHQFVCRACDFQVFKNVAATTSLVLVCGAEILFSKRGREPSKGLLDFPGGFVDPDETLEQGLNRELVEEIGWTPESLTYLFSSPNTYCYKGVTYKTADAFFLSEVQEKPRLMAMDDVDSLVWLDLNSLDDSQLAFESMKRAVQLLRTKT